MYENVPDADGDEPERLTPVLAEWRGGVECDDVS
jgi:hypothetical protein